MSINLYFLGDTFNRSKNEDQSPYNYIKHQFSDSDLTFLNLETVVLKTTEHEPIKKSVTIHQFDDKLIYLKDIKCNVVNLANNHILDYGVSGLKDTLGSLQDVEIDPLGVYENVCKIYEIKGTKVGLLCLNNKTVKSKESKIIMLGVYDRRSLNYVRKLRKDVDYLFISVHWGIEHVEYPTPEQRKIAKLFVDNGADMIIGHHSHTLQFKEVYKSKLIYYSLGNFNFWQFDTTINDLNRSSIILKAILDSKKKSLEFYEIPIYINEEYMPTACLEQKYYCKLIAKHKNYSKLFYETCGADYLKSNLQSWKIRIKRYGIIQFFLMLIWLMVKPFNYKCYYYLLKVRIERVFTSVTRMINNEKTF